MVLFGNLELNEMETFDSKRFGEKVSIALEEGTSGTGRGFVLMPSAMPIGRVLKEKVMANYRKIVEVYEAYYGTIG